MHSHHAPVAKTALLLALAYVSGCASTATAPHQAYQPKFSYSAPSHSAQKLDITVGIVAPQFTGDGTRYQKDNKDDEVVRGMLRGIRTGFNDVIVAKGFNASGPFDSLEMMTFPEKKGADFVLYPEFDIEDGYAVTNLRKEAPPMLSLATEPVLACDVVIQPKGAVSIVAREPLSNERMWIKKVDVSVSAERFAAKNPLVCSKQAITPEMKDGWARAHEALYAQVMGSLDKYVNAEEFQSLKRQSAELRAKKVY